MNIPVQIDNFVDPDGASVDTGKWRYEERVPKNNEWIFGEGGWRKAGALGYLCPYLVATPIPAKVKVEGWLYRDDDGTCHFDGGGTPYYAGRSWSRSRQAWELNIPESEWPAPGESKPYTLDVDAVAGASHE